MAVFTTQGSGNWNSTTPNLPWLSGIVPSSTDTVFITNGHTVTLTDNRIIAGLTGDFNGILISANSSSLTINFDAREDICQVRLDGNLNIIKTGVLGTGIFSSTHCQILSTGSLKVNNGFLKLSYSLNLVPVTCVGNDGTAARVSVFEPAVNPLIIGPLTLGDGTGYGIVRSATAGSLLTWGPSVVTAIYAVGLGNVIEHTHLSIMGSNVYNNPISINVASGGALEIQCRIDHNNVLRKTGDGTLRISFVHTTLNINTHVDAGTLLVNGRINGAASGVLTVHNGATLGGNGQIDSAVVVECGTLSPGDPLIDAGVGVLTIYKDSE